MRGTVVRLTDSDLLVTEPFLDRAWASGPLPPSGGALILITGSRASRPRRGRADSPGGVA